MKLKLLNFGIGVDLKAIKPASEQRGNDVVVEATLSSPITGNENTRMQSGGKDGMHSEQSGVYFSRNAIDATNSIPAVSGRAIGNRQKEIGNRQKAKGKEAKGKRQKAKGKRQKAKNL